MQDSANRFFVVILGALLFVAIFLIASPSGTSRPPVIHPSTQGGSPSTSEFLKKGSVGVSEIQKGNGGKNLLTPFRPITGVLGNNIPPVPPPAYSPSDAELFHILFPNFYLADLARIGAYFQAWGWMRPDEHIALTNEKEVLAFLRSATEVAIEKKFYPESIVPDVREAVQKNFPAFLEKKKEAIRHQQSLLYRSFDLGDVVHEHYTADFIATLFPFFPETAHAQLDFQVEGVCFKAFNPSQGIKGVDLYSFCCNCGIKFVGYVPVYMPDCTRQYNDICDVQLGCLNMTCEGYEGNAIWDGTDGLQYDMSAPYTNKCGCDEPQKVQQNQQQD